MDAGRSVFWDDLASDLRDPEFLREYVAESIRIATIDRIVNELDAARAAAGLTKAGLARAISSEPATVRRLFSSGHVNPTLGTLAEVAAALGMRVVLEPLGAGDREQITRPLLEGMTEDPRVLAERLGELRNGEPGSLAASCSLRSLCKRARVPMDVRARGLARADTPWHCRPPCGSTSVRSREPRHPASCQPGRSSASALSPSARMMAAVGAEPQFRVRRKSSGRTRRRSSISCRGSHGRSSTRAQKRAW